MFNDIYKGKTVLITGHTGFKGSWLSTWLITLGAKVVGYSAYLPSDPCNFEVSGLRDKLSHEEGDVRDLERLREVFKKYEPDIVFHLAAQPLVRESYKEPKLTFDTNIGGTVNVLEAIRITPSVGAAVMITSDKCYKNVEWVWGYRENDVLGGDDPYSASKGAAEIVANSYIQSFFQGPDNKAHIATTRAGNVIGGGDWAVDRIIPDCVKAWSKGESVFIRTPNATRPWQHVLEPLSGYLWLGAKLFASKKLHGEAFNFGPDQTVNEPVGKLIEVFLKDWGSGEWTKGEPDKDAKDAKEANLLKLSCDKALHHLGWHSVLTFDETIKFTARWYKAYYEGSEDIFEFTLRQIESYVEEAAKKGLSWVNGGEK